MRTTIDGAGRLVVPKPIRDRLHLTAGTEVEVDEHDGVVTIQPRAVEIEVVATDGGLVARAIEDVPRLTDEDVRATLDAIRR